MEIRWDIEHFYIFSLPPIGLSVYETYGRSESEHMLIGGETGREFEHDAGSSFGDDIRLPLTAIVFPRCNRFKYALCCAPWASDPCCDCSEPIFTSLYIEKHQTIQFKTNEYW